MKLNNKGFAISSIMYIILIMCIILITVTLSILSSRNLILDKQKKETLDNIYGETSYRPSVPEPVSFEADTWATIVANVKAGNTSAYTVGSTKEVNLGSTLGTHTLRIANNSTPSECNTEGFSQTACGFVIEFADIITEHYMNPEAIIEYNMARVPEPTLPELNLGANAGGWADSDMRTYVNETIYNSLPTEIKSNIIDTYVVSGHGGNDSSNFETTDKLYLLSITEVWGRDDVYYDTAETETRQLDYYKNNGVTTSSSSGAIKNYNGSAYVWWLRSANSDDAECFFAADDYGDVSGGSADLTRGVSPAFRIG